MEQANNSTRNKSQSSKMSTVSSSANEYDQYMKQFYIKKNDPSSAGLSFTHTRIPSPEHGVVGGTFCIPHEKNSYKMVDRFWLIWILGMDLILIRVNIPKTILKILLDYT